MKRHLGIFRSILLSASIGLIVLSFAQSSRADELLIGDAGDNSVKAFDADTGAYHGAFIPSGTAGLNGPMGLILTDGQLVVVNQNITLLFFEALALSTMMLGWRAITRFPRGRMTVLRLQPSLLGALALVTGALANATAIASTPNFDTGNANSAANGTTITPRAPSSTVAGTIVLGGISVPIANAGPNREGEVGDRIVLDGRKSYAPSSPQTPLTYLWLQLSGPATVTLTGVTTVNPSFTPSVPGLYVFSLVVRGNNVSSTPSTVQVNVLPADGGCLGCNPFSK